MQVFRKGMWIRQFTLPNNYEHLLLRNMNQQKDLQHLH